MLPTEPVAGESRDYLRRAVDEKLSKAGNKDVRAKALALFWEDTEFFRFVGGAVSVVGFPMAMAAPLPVALLITLPLGVMFLITTYTLAYATGRGLRRYRDSLFSRARRELRGKE